MRCHVNNHDFFFFFFFFYATCLSQHKLKQKVKLLKTSTDEKSIVQTMLLGHTCSRESEPGDQLHVNGPNDAARYTCSHESEPGDDIKLWGTCTQCERTLYADLNCEIH